MATTPAVHQVNLLALLLLPLQEQGDLASTLETKYHTTARDPSFARKLEEAQVVPFHLLLLQLNPSSQPEGTTTLPSLQSTTDDNGTPATWTLGLVFQQAIDRQDRTPAEGRFSYWNYTGDIITAWYTGILHRTRTRCNDDMPCRHPPLRLVHTLQDTTTPRRTTDFASPLVFASHRSSTLPATTGYFARPTNGNRTFTGIRPIWQPILPLGLSTAHYEDSCTTQYFRWYNIDAKPLATKHRCQYHESIMIQFMYSLFLQYTKLLNLFSSTLLPYIPQEYTPTPLL